MSLDQNTRALVTGASSGIGEATARALRAKCECTMTVITRNRKPRCATTYYMKQFTK